MSEPIKPALTPEEWETMRLCDFAHLLDKGLSHSQQRYVVAALALQNEPFGFTRQDLKLLEHCEASVGWKLEEEVRNLAARIEALLPRK